MSLAETDTNVESIAPAKDRGRFGLNQLQQFARAGLDLKIGDFRQMCEELCDRIEEATGAVPNVSDADAMDANDLADVLFAWMTATLSDA